MFMISGKEQRLISQKIQLFMLKNNRSYTKTKDRVGLGTIDALFSVKRIVTHYMSQAF